eukprot:g23257.t1
MTPVLVLDLSGGELRLGLTSALKPYCETNCWARSWPKGGQWAFGREVSEHFSYRIFRPTRRGLLLDLAQQRQILLRVLQRAQLERKAAEMAVLAVLAPLTPDAWTAERGPWDRQLQEEAQKLILGLERLMPEALFRPQDYGIPCAGVTELVVSAVRAVPEELWRPHLGRVVLCGGLARLEGLLPRLQRELRKELPEEWPVELLQEEEPEWSVWRGAVQHALHAEGLWSNEGSGEIASAPAEEIVSSPDAPVPKPKADAPVPGPKAAAGPTLTRARTKRPQHGALPVPGAEDLDVPRKRGKRAAGKKEGGDHCGGGWWPSAVLRGVPRGKSSALPRPHPSQPSKPKRPQTPGSARVLRESPVHASETLTSAMAEELRETAPVPRSEWGFERRHGPKHSVATARRPPSLASLVAWDIMQLPCLVRFFVVLLGSAWAAKLAAAPGRLQQDTIVNLLASSAGHGTAKSKASEMEAMVLMLAQQAKLARTSSNKAEGNITEFVGMIKKELHKMTDNIHAAVKTVDEGCKASFSNLSAGCPVYGSNTTFLPSGFNGDFTPLREAHSSCRSQISSRKQEMESCKSSRESLILQEHTLTTQFRSINVFESPEECTVKGTDVLGYLASMRDHFDGKKLVAQDLLLHIILTNLLQCACFHRNHAQTIWWSTYYKLENITNNITKWNCTEKELAYFEKLTECQEKQLALEETACMLHDRTKEACAQLPACFESNWKGHSSQVALANGTINDSWRLKGTRSDGDREEKGDLKFEYVAVKRILCMLDAFSDDDIEAKIEACMATAYSSAGITSVCVENFATASKPKFVTPEVCLSGVKAILHPNDENFNETEYASQGIPASHCLASCCDLSDLYHWQTYTNAFVTFEHYMYDSSVGQLAAYSSMDEAKNACETMGSVLCFGIYDANCDGPTRENPVKLIKAPGLDLESVQESSVGSCIQKLMSGPGTTLTTTTVRACTYQIQYESSQAPGEIKTMEVPRQEYGEAFRFSGCDSQELDEGKDCVAGGASNGVRLLKNRYGQAVGTGSCCTSETNKVVEAKPLECDGFKDEYTKFNAVYLTASNLIRGTSYRTLFAAKVACLKMGHKCWGLFDDKCDMGNIMLVDGDLNITNSSFRVSHQSSCFERSHGPVDAHRFERRTKSGPTSGTSSLFTGGFSPSFHSTRMALALGAIEGGELPEEPFLYMESGGGLFARTLDVRRLPGGYRPFLPCTDFDEYDLHVKEFKEALRLQRVRRNLHGRLGKFAQSAPASRRLGRGPGERSRRRVSQVGW